MQIMEYLCKFLLYFFLICGYRKSELDSLSPFKYNMKGSHRTRIVVSPDSRAHFPLFLHGIFACFALSEFKIFFFFLGSSAKALVSLKGNTLFSI